uniref:Uncharacterized protein n=1 Tax=Panagrolaimus sp. ES5 TaxID=591445 RepID=A0AC34F1B5_9BILA
MPFFGDIRFLGFIYFALFLDVLAAKPLGVPFFALRRHQTSMRHGFGPISQTKTDVFSSQFMTSGVRAAGRGKPVPSYTAGMLNDEEENNERENLQDVKEPLDYEPTPVTLPPPPSILAARNEAGEIRSQQARPQYPSNLPASNLDSYLSNLPSRSLIDKIEHPIAAHRVRMNSACLMDPPLKARFTRNAAAVIKPIIFYSFNPAGQSCDKLVIDENDLIIGPNVYESLRECQKDCCPTALCRRM